MSNKYDPELTPFKANEDISNEEIFYFIGENDLSNDIDDVLANNEHRNEQIFCNIVLFRCNTKLSIPFIEYALFLKDDKYNFITFDINNKLFDDKRNNHPPDITKPDFDNYDFLNELISNNLNDYNIDDYKNLGFYKIENQLFIFLMTQHNSNIDNSSWSIIDEIMSYQNIDNINIDPNVRFIFDQNKKFMYIKNNNNQIMDIPILVFNRFIHNNNDNEKKINTIKFSNHSDTFKEPDFINTSNYGEGFVFSSFPPPSDEKFMKYALFISDCYYIFINEDPSTYIINNNKDNSDNYPDKDILFISDNNNNGFYLVRSIEDFTRL